MAANNEQEGQVWFEPAWFKEHGIKGYFVDSEAMDFESPFMKRLEISLDNGPNKPLNYDPEKWGPIVITKSENPELNGLPENGKHRLVQMDRLIKKGRKLPNPFVLGYHHISSISEFRAARMKYEMPHLMHKDQKTAEKSMMYEAKQIYKTHRAELTKTEQLETFLGDLGGFDPRYVHDYAKSIIEHEQKKRDKQNPPKPAGDWPEKKDEGNQETITEMGQTTSYRACPCCEGELAILVDDETRKVAEIKKVKELTH